MAKNFVQKIMGFIKSGDEGKVIRFSNKLDKYFSVQIRLREDEIETLEEKKIDVAEVLSDSILNVDKERIQSTDDIEDYCVDYVQSNLAKLDSSDDIQEKIDELKAQIDRLKALQSAIESVEAKVETSK